MTRGERAAQIWPLLTLCASMRRTISYDELGKRIGVPRPGLGQLLEPIQSYCLLHGLPPLTVLVVSEVDGMPGTGFTGAQDVPRAQAAAFGHDWMKATPPDSRAFEAAVEQLPSNGGRS